MLGAEAVAAVELVSNVVQFVDSTVDLCSLMRTYSSALRIPNRLVVEQANSFSNPPRLSDLLDLTSALWSLCWRMWYGD